MAGPSHPSILSENSDTDFRRSSQKAARSITDVHEAQLLNYLKATGYKVGLLLNFGPKPDKRRKVYDNELK
jgi:hypothetical protein